MSVLETTAKFPSNINIPGSEQNENLKDLLSYGTFIQDIKNFKRAGTRTGDEFNYLDAPAHLYFKILFYFYNGDIDNPGVQEYSGGLLSPTWNYIGNNTDYYNYNSAWAYLKMNNENERAEKLERFVNLLSNINIYSPWYFQSIEGLDQALTRIPPDTGEFKFDERKKITIKCLVDSYDNRIGTLLDLYRDVVWSWMMKREVIPSNLRKFDMGIYIFSSPIFNIHDYNKNYAKIGDNSGYITSYKYLEFHNCEIDYNSSVAGYQTLDNTIGSEPIYNLNIYYDDCYEKRYNEYMLRNIGDIILYDVAETTVNNDGSNNDILIKSEAQVPNMDAYNESMERTFYYNDKGLLEGALNEVVGWAKDKVRDIVMPLYLGNIYGFSLKSAISDVNNLMKGKVFATVDAASGFVNKNLSPKTKKLNLSEIKNIFKKNSARNNI